MSSPRPRSDPTRFRDDIQGLRALAVLAVVFYHARFPLFTGGYVGVDVFFVISGYLISGLLLRELEQTGRVDLRSFYARRIRRLLPAAALLLIATAAAASLWVSPLEQRELALALFFATLYAGNIWYGWNAIDYLAADVQSDLLLHMWSLGVEEQFYLVWPLVMVVAARWLYPGRLRLSILVAMTAVFVGSLAASLWLTSVVRPWAFFSSPTRAWEFAAGGLIYLAAPHVESWPEWSRRAVRTAGLALVLATVLILDDNTAFPGTAALLPVAGTAVLLLTGSRLGLVGRWLASRPMRLIGDVSYSWYLWHWPILVFPLGEPWTIGERTVRVALSFLLACASYWLVENRVRFSSLLSASPARSIAVGVCLTVVGMSSAVALRGVARAAMSSPEQTAYAQVRSDRARIYHEDCHVQFFADDSPHCVYGDPQGKTTVVLFGDSHAAQWFPALERLAVQKGWRLVSLTKSACPWAWVTPFNPHVGRRYDECARWRSAVVRRIVADQPGLVILANQWRYVTGSSIGFDAPAWRQGLQKTLGELRPSGARIVILRDTPWPGFDVPRCLSRAAWRGLDARSMCTFDRQRALNTSVFEMESRAASQTTGVAVIDLTDAICDTSICSSIHRGQVVYSDNHHLTAAMSTALAPALLQHLTSSGGV